MNLVRGSWGALRANPEPFRAALGIFRANTPEEREQHLADLEAWSGRLRLQLEREVGLSCAKKMAGSLLSEPWPFRSILDDTPHLGSLGPLSAVPATRLDYVAVHLDLLLRMKKRYPYLGLSSTNLGVNHRGNSLSGLEVAQTLAISLSAGHLWGTFATERAVLFALDEQPKLIEALLERVPESLRDWSQGIVDRREIRRFFYVLAAAQSSGWASEAAQPPDVLVQALECFARPTESPSRERLQWAFRTTRQIAYQRIQALLKVGLAFDNLGYDALLEYLRENEEIAYDKTQPPTLMQQVLSAMDRLHSESVFTSREAASLVLKHLREFRIWWSRGKTEGDQGIERILTLRRRPPDWPSAEERVFAHYCRLRLPPEEMRWPAEVRAWREGGAFQDGTATFLLTPPGPEMVGSTLLDVYSAGNLGGVSRYRIMAELASRCRASWGHPPGERERELWRTTAIFMRRLFQDTVRSGYRVMIEPVLGSNGHVAYALASEGLERALEVIGRVAESIDDEVRQRELMGICEHLRQTETEVKQQWGCILGKVLILGQDDGKPRAELDGLWVSVDADELTWTALEHKTGRESTRQQLDKLRTLLSGEVDVQKETTLPSGRARRALIRPTTAR